MGIHPWSTASRPLPTPRIMHTFPCLRPGMSVRLQFVILCLGFLCTCILCLIVLFRMCGHRSDHLLDHQASQGLMVPYVLNPQHPNSIPLQSDEPLRYLAMTM